MDQITFARFVRRAVDEAKAKRGWTVTRLAAETGVGRSTLFRWLSGDGQEFPELANVRDFCDTLGIPVGAAFAALGVSDDLSGEDAATRADVTRILAKLADPALSAPEKTMIRDMLRYLATDSPTRAEAG